MSTVTTDRQVNLVQLLGELSADGGALRHNDADGTVEVDVPGASESRLSDAISAHVAEPEPDTPTLTERLDAAESRLDSVAALAEKANVTATEVATAAKPQR